jgi:3-deoxy-7-phosphoheptulonate synthase
MLVVMQPDATSAQIERVGRAIEELGFTALPIPGARCTAIAVVGNETRIDSSRLEALPGVAQVVHVTRPYREASRETHPENTVVAVAPGVTFGGDSIPVIAGPCAVETEHQLLAAAHAVRAAGAVALRGGAFKPRSSPYSFQGLGRRGLEILSLAGRETGLAIVTEALDEEGANLVAEYADCIQVGARNMQNYSLLRAVGRIGKPVLLKRGLSATISDLLLSAEYILAEGNDQVILCERGIRSFDSTTRNLLDLSAIPIVQRLSHLPIIADPSHGTGVRVAVGPMACAAVAAGAAGLIIEVHPNPDRALSDGGQSLAPDEFLQLMGRLRDVAAALGRSLAQPEPALRASGTAVASVG